MANTFAPKFGRAAGAASRLGHAKIVITSTETYATPTGITVDFFLPFNDIGVNAYDVVEITGYTVTGYLAVFTKGTLSSTSSPWTVRLWTPSTSPAEIADGAIAQTIHANIFFYPGAK
jgi:hypothetical protein